MLELNSIRRIAHVNGIFFRKFGILFQIRFGYGVGDFVGAVRIDERVATPFKTGAGETSAIDSRRFLHDIIKGDLFRRAAFPRVDTALTRLEGDGVSSALAEYRAEYM